MDVLAPTDSSTVGEENEEMVETETTLLRRIQSMTLVFERVGGVPEAAKGTSNDATFFSGGDTCERGIRGTDKDQPSS